jgi:hypothetical protein
MAASAGALLFMIPSMVGMYKMTSKPWYFPKDWFFIPFLVILGGVALEWCFRSARCKTEDIDKDSK